jgi:hypothetical protein
MRGRPNNNIPKGREIRNALNPSLFKAAAEDRRVGGIDDSSGGLAIRNLFLVSEGKGMNEGISWANLKRVEIQIKPS